MFYIRGNITNELLNVFVQHAQVQTDLLTRFVSHDEATEIPGMKISQTGDTTTVSFIIDTHEGAIVSDADPLLRTRYSGVSADVKHQVLTQPDGTIDQNTQMLLFKRVPSKDFIIVTLLDKSVVTAFISKFESGASIRLGLVLLVMAGLSGTIIFLTMGQVQDLAGITQKISSGRLDIEIDTSGYEGEIESLAVGFNGMIQALKKSNEQLEQTRNNLEMNVVAKTKELAGVLSGVQTKNLLLEDNKKAMFNLLEDSRTLEDSLKDERDRVTAILNTMSEGLCVVDKNGKIISVNPVACNLLGMDEKSFVGKMYAETVILYKAGQSVSDPNIRPLLRTLKTGESLSGGLEENYSYKRPDGTFVPISWSTVALKRGTDIVGVIATFHDISHDLAVKETIEKKVDERTREITEKNIALEKAQKQVSEGWIQQQREKARLTASINSLSLGFILTDMEDHIITMNPASQGIIGLSSRPDDLKVIEALLRDVVDIHKLHEQCHTEQKPIHIESVLYGRKYLRIFLAPIVLITSQEEHLGTVILIEDISEAKTLERSREEFFSIASHELRTPLTAIRGNTSLIREHYFEKLEPDLQEMVTDIHESSVRLINIVNDFLNMTRLEQQRLEFKSQPFDLEDLIKKAIKEYQVTSSRQKIALDLAEPPTPVPAAFADPERVRQVIINLIGNAMKFTEEGAIKIGLVQVDGMVEVTVSDNGRGIPIANQSLLFHKFQQAGDSLFTRDTTKGTGLGLYISKLMIEAMGGKIWLVKSEPDKGSVFAFTLPVAK